MRKKISYFCAVCLIFVLVVATTRNIFSQQAPASGTTILLDSGNHSVNNGQNLTVGLGMTNPSQPVSGIDAVIGYDSSFFDVVDISLGNTSLKTLAPLSGNDIDLAKAVKADTANPPSSLIDFGILSFDTSNNQITQTLSTSYDPLTNPIATIVLHAKKEGTTSLDIKFDGNGKSTDSNIVSIISGVPTDIMSSPGDKLDISISPVATPTPLPLSECVKYDFDSDLKISVTDIMQIAARWNQKTGDTRYEAKYDLNSDGVISILDIQKIASKWGAVCAGN